MAYMLLDLKNNGAGFHMASNRSLKFLLATVAFAATSSLPALSAPESVPPGFEVTATESEPAVVSTAAQPASTTVVAPAARVARPAPKMERRAVAERRPAPRPVQRVAYNESAYYVPAPAQVASSGCSHSIVCGGSSKLLLVGIGF
jgi:hypothetical protein